MSSTTNALSAGKRLLVAQMAATGESPPAIKRRLRDVFGLDNAEEIVDQILYGAALAAGGSSIDRSFEKTA